MTRVSLKIVFGEGRALGPGKIRLLELVAESGSISAAARAMDMSYRRAWVLIEEVNRLFGEKAVATKAGGTSGGGAALTPFGTRLIAQYREVERQSRAAADAAWPPPAG